MFLDTDITSLLDFYVTLFVGGVMECFDLLDAIKFHGLSLLDFCLAMILLPAGISILIAINKSGSIVAHREIQKK